MYLSALKIMTGWKPGSCRTTLKNISYGKTVKRIFFFYGFMKRKRTFSYKLSIGININWIGLIRHYHPELEDKDKARNFVNKFIAEEDIDLRNSLFQNEFRLIEFYNDYSGMYQVWSDYHKTFIDDLVIRGNIFSPSSYFPTKDSGNKILAVGTTTTRVLETLAKETGHIISVHPFPGFMCPVSC